MATGATITAFRNRPWLLTIYVVLGALMIVQGLATMIYFLYFGEADYGLWVVILGLSVALAGFGLWFAAYGWRRLSDPEPPITIGPAGLFDRALSAQPIVWRDIANLHIWRGQGGPVVAFDLADGAGERAGVRRGAHVSAAISRLSGHNYHIRSMGTDATMARLVDAIRPYAEIEGG